VVSVLNPICACNDLGIPHTVTLTLTVEGLSAKDVSVTFLIVSGPNEGLEGSGLTNAEGQASFTWTSSNVGLDTIIAIGLVEGVSFQAQAVKCWVEAATPTPSATPSPSPTASPSSSPSPSPSPSPSATPTLTPSPTPTPTPIEFHFIDGVEGWRYFSPEPFDHPTSSATPGNPGFLSILAHTNTNSYGYWESPVIELGAYAPRLASEGPVPTSAQLDIAKQLFSAKFLVRSNVSDRSKVPQFRLRTTSVTYEETYMLVADSRSDGSYSPDAQGETYQLLFTPASGSTKFLFCFDLLNFNPMDAANGELILDRVVLERFDLSMSHPRTPVKTYTFEDGTMGWTAKTLPGYPAPIFSNPNGTLAMQGVEGENVGGYWGSPESDIPLMPGKIYIATFEVESDVPLAQRTIVPQLRCRLNETSFHIASIATVESKNAALGSPVLGIPHTYTVFLNAPESITGQGLIVSFDYLNLGAVDKADATLFLRQVKIETLPDPFATTE
jgi:hypothetical protein